MKAYTEEFQRLLENQLFIKAEKCKFHITPVSFLGFIYLFIYFFLGGSRQMWTDPVNVKVVEEWPTPEQFQKFTGFPNFYSRFIRNYHQTAIPLVQLTSTLSHFNWTSDAKTDFCKLKGLFTSASILGHPDPTK